jgi:hypothetical protein
MEFINSSWRKGEHSVPAGVIFDGLGSHGKGFGLRVSLKIQRKFSRISIENGNKRGYLAAINNWGILPVKDSSGFLSVN